jgi:hypothetical protein
MYPDTFLAITFLVPGWVCRLFPTGHVGLLPQSIPQEATVSTLQCRLRVAFTWFFIRKGNVRSLSAITELANTTKVEYVWWSMYQSYDLTLFDFDESSPLPPVESLVCLSRTMAGKVKY